jgi:hypothetical protein
MTSGRVFQIKLNWLLLNVSPLPVEDRVETGNG